MIQFNVNKTLVERKAKMKNLNLKSKQKINFQRLACVQILPSHCHTEQTEKNDKYSWLNEHPNTVDCGPGKRATTTGSFEEATNAPTFL